MYKIKLTFTTWIVPGERIGTCPRLSKKYKQEWAFFLDHRNRMKYNELCKKCEKECKQSFRAVIIDCPYQKKIKHRKGSGRKWIKQTT